MKFWIKQNANNDHDATAPRRRAQKPSPANTLGTEDMIRSSLFTQHAKPDRSSKPTKSARSIDSRLHLPHLANAMLNDNVRKSPVTKGRLAIITTCAALIVFLNISAILSSLAVYATPLMETAMHVSPDAVAFALNQIDVGE